VHRPVVGDDLDGALQLRHEVERVRGSVARLRHEGDGGRKGEATHIDLEGVPGLDGELLEARLAQSDRTERQEQRHQRAGNATRPRSGTT